VGRTQAALSQQIKRLEMTVQQTLLIRTGRGVTLTLHGERLLADACRRGLLTRRGADRVLKVARTVADLGASKRVRLRDLGTALALRIQTPSAGARVA